MAALSGFASPFCGTPDIPSNPLCHRRLDRQRRATRTLFRKNRQFHQWRTVGTDNGGLLGGFVPQGSWVSRSCETSLTTLRSDARRIINLCLRSMAFVEIRRYPKGSGEIDGGVPDSLRNCKNRKRILSTARRITDRRHVTRPILLAFPDFRWGHSCSNSRKKGQKRTHMRKAW